MTRPISKTEKQLRGTARSDREPQPKLSDIVKPLDHMPPPESWLSDSAKEIYHQAASELLERGQLQAVGLPLLAVYCHSVSKAKEIEVDLYKAGNNYTITDYKRLQQIARAYLEQARKLAIEFGLTPYSQGKITIIPPKEEKEPNELDLI